MSRNPVTDLCYQAGELKDDVQRLLHRAEQVTNLAIAVTEQGMVHIATVRKAFVEWVDVLNIQLAKTGMRNPPYIEGDLAWSLIEAQVKDGQREVLRDDD